MHLAIIHYLNYVNNFYDGDDDDDDGGGGGRDCIVQFAAESITVGFGDIMALCEFVFLDRLTAYCSLRNNTCTTANVKSMYVRL